MAVTYASFILEFAEFDALPQTLVEAKIADAQLLKSEAAFGPLYDIAVKYTAANLLSMTPEGENMALKNDAGENIYTMAYDREVRAQNIRRAAVL